MTGDGIRIACEDVCFEGIDFTWEAGSPDKTRWQSRAMFQLAAQAVEFRGCSFATTASEPPSVISWMVPDEDRPAVAGQVRLLDCVAAGVAAIVDCRSPRGASVELNNTLCVAAGPILRLHRPLVAGQSIAIDLDHVTTRGDSAVLELRYARLDEPVGSINVSARDSAFDGNPQGGLLVFVGSARPVPLLQSVTWGGQGSLVVSHMAMAMWQHGAKRGEVLPEDELEVAGLVRSRIEFAGKAQGPPSASRVTRWQGPLRNAEPPGADPDSLYLPDP